MLQYLLMCRSLTYAQRASKILERSGIFSTLTKIPKSVAGNGCTYCIKINARSLSDALQILNSNDFGPVRVFVLERDGMVSEVGV